MTQQRFYRAAAIVLSAALLGSVPAYAQKQEAGFTLGKALTIDRLASTGERFSLDSGVTLQADYEYRFLKVAPFGLYVGGHFLANPQRRVISSAGALTRDVATIYLTPEVMLKLNIGRWLSPWATAGGGVAIYEQSLLLLNGRTNPASRDVSHGTFMWGGGLDIPILHFIAARGEVRDFYSGNPSYNVALRSAQHNVVVGGGFVLRFGR